MKIFIKRLGYGSALIASAYFYGQNVTNQYEGKVGVNTEAPKATLDVSVLTSNQNGTTNEGIIAPKLSKERISKMQSPEEGTLVYATDAAYTGNVPAVVAKITEKGYYYFDGTEWVRTGGVVANSSGSANNFNIYNKSDKLTTNRVVTLDGHTLNFKGTKSVTVEPNFGLNITGQLKVTETPNGADADKILVVGTDGIVKKIDKTTKSFVDTNTNIYNENGKLTGDRAVDLKDHSLNFTNTTSGKTVAFKVDPANETVELDGKVKVKTPENGGNSDKILVVDKDGIVKTIDKTSDSFTTNGSVVDTNTNIYTDNGEITTNRTVTLKGTNSSLAIKGTHTSNNRNIGISVTPTSEMVSLEGRIKVGTPENGGNTDKILVVGGDGVIKTIDKTKNDIKDTTLYSTDGTLTGNRIIHSNDHTLYFEAKDSDKSGFIIGATNTKKPKDLFRVNLTANKDNFVVNGLKAGANTDEIVSVDSDGNFHKIPVANIKGNSGVSYNIYTQNDKLTGDRTVTMDKHSLTFKGTKDIKLEENGTITAESYRSTTFNSFPDYVFQKYYSGHSSLKADYTFNTLSQVEDYIKTNGHLPGYQSAMEIKNQGFVDIAKTQLSNVEKIEELYLHTIEQDKELKNKDKKIKELEYRLEKLESLLSKFNK